MLGLLIYGLSSQAQTLTGGEYFFDTAPAMGGGTPVTFAATDTLNQSLSVSVSSLSAGFHYMFVRVKNAAGVWSHYEGRLFYIITPSVSVQPTLVSGEWFVDTDPGLGNGTAISFSAADSVNQAINISASGFSTGFHYLFIRVKNAAGIWSHYEGRLFYMLPPAPSNQPALVSGEWFADTDPGFGNGTAITFSASDTVNQVINISGSGFSTGFHYLFVRVKNAAGVWSHYEGRLFYVVPVSITSQPTLVQSEWFVDTDPGLGNGTAINFAPADTVNPFINITTSVLSLGTHYLFIRSKNADGIWSHYEGRSFIVQICSLGITASTTTTAICQGSVALITSSSAGSGLTYQWYLNGNLQIPTADSLNATSAGNYQVMGTDALGCIAYSNLIAIAVNPLPAVSINLSSVDTLCTNAGVINLSGESPLGGLYSGAGITGNTFDAGTTAPGTYVITYSYTDLNSCIGLASGSIYLDLCTGINESGGFSEITLSPNPNSGKFSIQSSLNKIESIKIYNTLGATIYQSPTPKLKSEIDLSNQDNGIYFVQIIDDKMNVVNRKIIKE